jgi:D-alanine--poly(phosphoribitol) ligase subunit 2
MSAQESFSRETGFSVQREVRDRIARLMRDRLHVDVEDPDQDLFEAGIIDSLGLVELLLGLESEFGVRTDTEDLDIDNFRSLQRATAYVMEHRDAEGR